MEAPTWWMMWFDDGDSPVEYFRKKYGARPTHIEVPLNYSAVAVERLKAAGFEISQRGAVGNGTLLLGCAGVGPDVAKTGWRE